MSPIDVILSVLLIFTAYKGYKKGLIFQVASLAALVLGIYGAIHFSGYMANLLSEKLDITTQYMPLLSFAITFIGIIIVVHLLAGLTEKTIDAVALGFVNRLAGLVFGVIKAAFILSICLVVLTGFDRNEKLITPEAKSKSYLYKPIYIIAPTIFPKLHFNSMKENQEDRVEENIV